MAKSKLPKRRVNYHDTCPICKKGARSDLCPHSFGEMDEKLEENWLRALIRDEVSKMQ